LLWRSSTNASAINPPAPILSANEVYPMIDTTATANPDTNEGFASGNNTFIIIII
jgi:hypothetical protein